MDLLSRPRLPPAKKEASAAIVRPRNQPAIAREAPREISSERAHLGGIGGISVIPHSAIMDTIGYDDQHHHGHLRHEYC